MPTRVVSVFALPSARAAITTFSAAAIWRTPAMTSSRTRIVATIQVGSRPTSTMATSTPPTSTLSAVRSMKTPSGETSPRARATHPSRKSVKAARQKSTKAAIPRPGLAIRIRAITTGVARMRAMPSRFAGELIRAGRRRSLRVSVSHAGSPPPSGRSCARCRRAAGRCCRRGRPSRAGPTPARTRSPGRWRRRPRRAPR